MASIRKEIVIHVRPERVWDAVRDIGALHTRLVPGFVTDVRMDDGARIVTFGNGMVAREIIVSIDEFRRRLVWSIVGGPLTHHNGSVEVLAEGADSRFVWTTDLLPNEMESAIDGMMEQAMPIIKATVEGAERRS